MMSLTVYKQSTLDITISPISYCNVQSILKIPCWLLYKPGRWALWDHLCLACPSGHIWLVAWGHCRTDPKAGKSGHKRHPFEAGLFLGADLLHQSSHLDAQSKWSGSSSPTEAAVRIRMAASNAGALQWWVFCRPLCTPSCSALHPVTNGVLLQQPSGYHLSVFICIER